MKKIIIIGPAHPLRGGLATFNERLAREYQNEGHQVILWTFSLQYPDFLFPGKTQYSSEPKPNDLDIRIEINAINPLTWLNVGRRIAQEKPDLVICRFWLPFMAPSLGTVLRVMRWFSKATIIGLIDNIVPHEKRFGDRPFAQYFTAACDAFVVMSKAVGEEMKTFTDKECRFVPHPIYDNYGEKVERTEGVSKLQLNDNERYILFFGFIRRYKGLDLLLDAFAIFKEKSPKSSNVKLLVAGEFYDDEQYYRQKIQDLGITEGVLIYADFIADDAVKYYFAAADLIVQPYRTATQSGISQIAYHFEKPMIVTNVGGLAEIVPHNIAGYVVESTPQYIADALIDFYENNRLSTFDEGVKAQKVRFSWKSMTDAFLKPV